LDVLAKLMPELRLYQFAWLGFVGQAGEKPLSWPVSGSLQLQRMDTDYYTNSKEKSKRLTDASPFSSIKSITDLIFGSRAMMSQSSLCFCMAGSIVAGYSVHRMGFPQGDDINAACSVRKPAGFISYPLRYPRADPV
jgi:hypothetical protein